jgi:hypothetical protein
VQQWAPPQKDEKTTCGSALVGSRRTTATSAFGTSFELSSRRAVKARRPFADPVRTGKRPLSFPLGRLETLRTSSPERRVTCFEPSYFAWIRGLKVEGFQTSAT